MASSLRTRIAIQPAYSSQATSQVTEMTRHWAVQGAKARFSELLDTSMKEGPQVITRRGVETAVLVPIQQWRQASTRRQRTLKELLLADEPRLDLDIPERGRGNWREPPILE